MTRNRRIRPARPFLVPLAAAVALVAAACADPTGSAPGLDPADAELSRASSCWGQASAVFARMGEMGQHSAQQPTPRMGLANLARALYDAGIIPEPTMAALGAFVADELGLSVDACMD